jgi:hypothetical protein
LDVAGRDVAVAFAPGHDPALLPVADSSVEVACHLYNDPREAGTPTR